MALTADVSAPSTREHILDVAFGLMSARGAADTSMRTLAKAAGCNVAAIYHYFPSKADLLRSVIEERQYALRLRELPEVDATLPPRQRLEALILSMWQGSLEEEAIWRLLLGEGLRGDETALAVGRELLETIEPALEAWIGVLFGDTLDAPSTAAIVMSQLFSFFVTHLFLAPEEADAEVRRQAARIAALAIRDDERVRSRTID
jgi:AcrR family transcriptional regulator